MTDVITRLAAAIAPTPLIANRTALNASKYVVYEIEEQSHDGIKSVWQIKTTTVTDTMAEGLTLEGLIDDALCSLGDGTLVNGVTASERTGGGWVNDGGRHLRFGYYRLIKKE